MKIKILSLNIFAYLLFIIGAIFVGFITYSNIGKGFIFNDEAYYLFHFKNNGQMLTLDRTNFYRIFRFLYTPDIKMFRTITISTLVFSNFLLFFSVLKYVKFGGNIFIYSLLGIFIGFTSWQISNISLQQYIGNTILVNIGISLWLFAEIFKINFLKIFSGFVLAFVLFDGNSHTVVLLPIFLFFMLSNKKKWLRNLILFSLGGILGITLYFLRLDSIENFKYQLTFLKEYLSFHRKQHSVSFMIKWMIYLFLNGILPIIIIYALLYFAKFRSSAMKTFNSFIDIVGVAVLITFVFFENIFPIVFILLVHLMVLKFLLKKDETIQHKYLLILLLLIPYGLSFGSQTWFSIRFHIYIVYYVLLIFIVIFKENNLNWKLGFLFIILLQTISFANILHNKGWKDFVFSKQNIPVKVNGYNLYLDQGRAKDIEDLRPYLQNQQKVIYSSNHLMGYLYILDAQPPIPYYFTLKNYLKFIVQKIGDTPDDYIYIESNDYPFNPKEIIPLQFVNHPEKYKTIKAGRFTLYLPENFQKK